MTDPFETLRRQFIDRCQADRERLTELEPDDDEVAFIVHRLAGAAGAFGFPELGRIASGIDIRLRNGDPSRPQDLERLSLVLARAIDPDGRA